MDRGQNRAAEEGAAPLRVAQIVGKPMAGGVENVVYNYYRRMDKAKVQFDFLVDADSQENLPDDLLEMGAGLHRIPPYQGLRHYMPARYDLVLAKNYPIVHAHLNTLNAFPLAAAKAAKVPVRICHNHSTACPGEGFRTHLKYALRPLAYRSATHCFACGAHAAVWMYGNDRFQDGKVALMHNAIDLDRFAFDAIQRQKMRERLGLGKNLVLGHAGRFMYQKNHAFLLEVFAALHERQPNSVLLLVGDGELRAEMGIRAVEMGLCGDCLRYTSLVP